MNCALAYYDDGRTSIVEIRWIMTKGEGPEPGTRWITVHPHGPDSEGQPVLIRESKTHPGTWHVIGGAGGNLNFLRLTNVKSEAEYRAQARQKAAERRIAQREQIKRDKELGMYEARTKAREHLKSQREQQERTFIEQVAERAGWERYDLDPSALQGLSDEAKEAAIKRHHRELLKKANEVVRQAKTQFLLSAEARAEAELGEFSINRTSPEGLTLGDFIKQESLGPHVQQPWAARAEARGVDLQEIEAETRKPPSKAVIARQETREAIEKELEQANLPAPTIEPKVLPPKSALEVIKAEKALKEAQKTIRKKQKELESAEIPEQYQAFVIEAKPVDDESVIENISKMVDEQRRTDLAKSFLAQVESDPLGTDPRAARTRLERHLAIGATAALGRASQVLAGSDVVDRHVVDALGIQGASQALAETLRATFGHDRALAMAERLQRYHRDVQEHVENEAMQRARDLYDEAEELELQTVENPEDLRIAAEVNAKRIELLQEARHIVGSTLGELESIAALSYALANARDTITVSLGAISEKDAVLHLRAIGLQAGDYTVDHDGTNAYASIASQAASKVFRVFDPQYKANYDEAIAIYNGKRDEPGWLPQGFASRPSTTFDDPDERAVTFARPFTWTGNPDADLADYVGGRMADGHPIDNIYRDLLGDAVLKAIPPEHHEAYYEAVERNFPLADEHGKVRRAESHRETMERMAEAYVAKKYGSNVAPIHKQHVDVRDHRVHEALHRVFAEDPKRTVAFKALGDLTSQDQDVLRAVFHERIGKKEEAAAKQAVLELLGPEPPRESEGLFGVQENPEWHRWQSEYRSRMAEARANSLTWDKYLALHGSRMKAYAALQDILKGEAAESFAKHYARIVKKPLKLGKTVISSNLAHLEAINPEVREKRLAQQRQLIDKLRNRVRGKYAAGSVKEKFARARELEAIASQNQRSLFLTHEDDGERPLDPDERYTLGATLERQLAGLAPIIARNFDPNRPVHLIPNLRMDGPYVQQQRAIKLIASNKRVALALGTGSGKTAIGLGAFTHLASQGKVQRGVFAVPSAVQAQFGAEAASMVKAGTWNWWGKPGATQEERLAAYRNPDHHFVIVTHQALRDDLIHLMQQHIGEQNRDAFIERFQKMPERERVNLMRETLQKHGINWNYIFLDEAHDELNRKGKPNSILANTLDALHQNAEYFVSASADPVKNDMSELYDLMHKLHPTRFSDRNNFLAKYGLGTNVSEHLLRREILPYVMPGRIVPSIDLHHQTISVTPTDAQAAEIEKVDHAYQRAILARSEGRIDEEAILSLSPELSRLNESERKQAMEAINQNLGLARDVALARAENLTDAKQNAKVQAVIEHAKNAIANGEPGIVFAHNIKAVQMLEQALNEHGIRTVSLTGADTAKKKGQKVMKFRPPKGREAEADVMILSDAGAKGLNLQRGRWVLHYDLPHTAMTYWQRIGRIHRLGQQHDVRNIVLDTGTPLHQRQKERIERKTALREMLTKPYEGMDDADIYSLSADEASSDSPDFELERAA